MSTRTHVVEVSGNQVRETMERLGDRVVRAIFVVEEPVDSTSLPKQDSPQDIEEILADMDANAVHTSGEVDDSREAMYTRLEGG